MSDDDNGFEVRFYHSRGRAYEIALTRLLEISISRDKNSVVRLSDDAMCDYYDEYLWTYSDDSFLPHGTDKSGDVEYQKIWLTTTLENPNGSEILFIAGAIEVEEEVVEQRFRMLCYVFGDDKPDKENARKEWIRWKQAVGEGVKKVSYWKQEGGKWNLEREIPEERVSR